MLNITHRALFFLLVLLHVLSVFFIVINNGSDKRYADGLLIDVIKSCHPQFTFHRCLEEENKKDLKAKNCSDMAACVANNKANCIHWMEGVSNAKDTPVDMEKCTRATNYIPQLLAPAREGELKQEGYRFDEHMWGNESITFYRTLVLSLLVSSHLLLAYGVWCRCQKSTQKSTVKANAVGILVLWNSIVFLILFYLFIYGMTE